MPRPLARLLLLAIPTLVSASFAGILPQVAANDNRAPAGRLRNGVLTVRLRAAAGEWSPEGRDGPPHAVHAFGVERGPLQTPGPLLRVPAGTRLHLTLRNEMAGAPLVVHGLRRRPGEPDTLVVASGAVRSVDFAAPPPGTYFYWGTTGGAPTLNARWGPDGQLVGAFIVDPPGVHPPDRVFLLAVESGPGPLPPDREILAAVVNGRSWPHTERLTARVGDTLRMRLINLSDRPHPMHLHGFYFRVDARGAIGADTVYTPEQRRLAVTELLAQGQTAGVTWVPERAGNWLFHCHMLAHVSPRLRRGAAHAVGRARHDGNHALTVMSGLAVGVRVLPARGRRPAAPAPPPARRLRLLVQSRPGYHGSAPGLGYVLQEGAREPAADSVAIPGAPLVLTRGEPVQITVVNRLAEPTSVHWHGIELDSWFDGVSGWSGSGSRTAPQIAPGDSFLVRFTPPRAGTFIYHTHFDEERQLPAGLYGPLLVLEPGERYDPERERMVVLNGYPGDRLQMQVNGSRDAELQLRAGRTYRVRLINIHANGAPRLSLLADSVPVRWRLLAKDGATVSPAQATVRPAVVRMGVGETYDFELEAGPPRELRLVGRDPAGGELVAARVRVVP